MQWYENNPVLLEAEKIVMSKHFPDFNYEVMADGRASWAGVITSSEEHKEYAVLVVYDNYHPFCYEEYSSVKIYPVFPDVDEIFGSISDTEKRDWLLKDGNENEYMLLRTEPDKLDNGATVHTAASFLHKAISWVNNYEIKFKKTGY